LKLERILCPLDFSEFSTRAFEYAQSLARRYKSKLLLEHVLHLAFSAYPSYTNPEAIDNVSRGLSAFAREQLRDFVRKHSREGIEIESFVDEGDVTDTILAFAQTRAVDLIVMGTHGRHGLDHILLGSVTEKVLRKARCPVLAVRKPAHEFVAPGDSVEPVHLGKILFGVDFSTYSERALLYALSLAEEYKAELTLLHVMEDFPLHKDLTAVTSEVVQQLEGLLPPSARNSNLLKPRLRVGKPYEEIIRSAREADTDLIILGVRGRNALDLAIFGSTTHRVIQKGPCPVLTVPL
jgi:nucleotide-binding universal stress UspA family protein